VSKPTIRCECGHVKRSHDPRPRRGQKYVCFATGILKGQACKCTKYKQTWLHSGGKN